MIILGESLPVNIVQVGLFHYQTLLPTYVSFPLLNPSLSVPIDLWSYLTWKAVGFLHSLVPDLLVENSLPHTMLNVIAQ